MKDALALIASLIAVLSYVPYILDTIKGKTKPNVVTWFTWFLLSGITAVAAYAGHAYQTAFFSGALTICDLLVVAFGLRDGVKKYSQFDVACQLLALAGVGVWRLTGTPASAIAINIGADLIGVLPTYRHSWQKPHEETWHTFAYGSFAAFLAVLSVKELNFVSLAYPIYILLSCLSITFTILYSLRKTSAQSDRTIKS